METNRELVPVRIPGSPLFKIHFQGGGEMPKALSGNYTSEKQALKAINEYQTKMGRINNATDSSK